MEELIKNIIKNGVLHSPEIIEAFRSVDRIDFVPKEHRARTYEDYPLPIGYDQTISQPSTVAFMLELLATRRGDKVLDIGSGSGWTTALLGRITGPSGKVFGVERIPALTELGQNNIKKYNTCSTISIEQSGEKLGLPQKAPFDRILVSAAADSLPRTVLEQLKEGGILIIPIGNAIHKITKHTNGKIDDEQYDGFAFVPLYT